VDWAIMTYEIFTMALIVKKTNQNETNNDKSPLKYFIKKLLLELFFINLCLHVIKYFIKSYTASDEINSRLISVD